jgi:hypothetical protein
MYKKSIPLVIVSIGRITYYPCEDHFQEKRKHITVLYHPFLWILRVIAKINLFFIIFTEIPPYVEADKVPYKSRTSMRPPGLGHLRRQLVFTFYLKIAFVLGNGSFQSTPC